MNPPQETLDERRDRLRLQLLDQRRDIAQRMEPEHRLFPRSMLMRYLLRRPAVALQIMVSFIAGLRAMAFARRQRALAHHPE